MTVWEFLRIAGRRWYVVVIGIILTAAGLYSVKQTPGVYTVQTDVLFLAPVTASNENTISSPTQNVIAMAGLVERIVNRGVEKSPTSGTVTLTGQGVDDGYSVELPNSGGQWSVNFNHPVLQVQVTGRTAEGVRTRLADLLERIQRLARDLQIRAGSQKGLLIGTQISPAAPVVAFEQGHRKMGLAAAALLGAVLTALCAVAMDGLVRRRRGIADPSSASPSSISTSVSRR